METQTIRPFDALTEIKEDLRRKKLTVEEAEILAGPYLEEFNRVSTEKAKKYGESPFYFNPHAIGVREAVSSSKIAEIKAKMLAAANAVDLSGIA